MGVEEEDTGAPSVEEKVEAEGGRRDRWRGLRA